MAEPGEKEVQGRQLTAGWGSGSAPREQGQERTASSCARKGSGGTSGRVSSLQGGQALEWAAQESGGVPIPGSGQEKPDVALSAVVWLAVMISPSLDSGIVEV